VTQTELRQWLCYAVYTAIRNWGVTRTKPMTFLAILDQDVVTQSM